MKSSEPPMKAVAKLAGVSTATVSHVINNSCNVKEDKKNKVKNAINQLKARVLSGFFVLKTKKGEKPLLTRIVFVLTFTLLLIKYLKH